MSNKMALDALTACPFCGKTNTLIIGKASDVFAEPDECGDPLPYMHTESYAVTCDASKPDGPGGCGASGGYKLTEELAVAAWNERAAIALQAEPQGWRPIETAPENTQVAALFRGERPVIAHKNVPHDIPSGWCHEFAGGHYFDHPTRGLTHWMPLPATPPKD